MEARDRLEILELLPRYARAIDQREPERLEEVFSADATFQVHGQIGDQPSLVEGRDTIIAGMRRRIAQVQPTQRRHIMINQIVEEGAAPDEATVHAYLLLATTTGGRLELLLTGRYTSGVRKVDGRWVLDRHVLHLDANLA